MSFLKIIEPRSGKRFNVTHEEFAKNGAGYVIDPDSSVEIVTPEGLLGSIKGSDYSTSIQRGFRPATDEDIKEFDLKNKYGDGTANEMKAFAAGAARGLSFGLSDVALSAADLGEDIALLKKYNPKASTIGEIGGSIAQFAIPGAPGLGVASKLGAAAGKTLAGKAAGKVLGEGLAKQFVKKGFETGTRSAVEAVFQETGRVISDVALGNPELSAENLTSRFLSAALIGGAAGGVMGGLFEGGLTRVAGKSSIIDDLAQGQAKRTLSFTPAQAAKFDSQFAGMGGTDGLAKVLKDADVFDWKGAFQKEKFDAALEAAGRAVGTAKTAIKEAPDLQVNVSGLINFMDDKIDAASQVGGNSDVARMYRKYKSELESQLDGYSISATDAFRLRNRYADDFAQKGQATLKETQKADAAKALRHQLMDDLAEQARQQGHGELMAPLEAANKSYSALKKISTNVTKIQSKESLEPGLSRVSGAIAAADGFISGGTVTGIGQYLLATGTHFAHKRFHSVLLSHLTLLEKANRGVSKAIEKVGSGTLGRTLNAVKDTARGVPVAALPALVNRQNYAEFQDKLTTITPEPLKRADLYDAMPHVSTALVERTIPSALSFINSKMPQVQMSALEAPRVPSSNDIMKLNRYVSALAHPEIVMARISAGVASDEEIEALRAVYPQMFAKIQKQITSSLKQGGKYSAGQKRVMSSVVGVPLSRETSPATTAAIQAAAFGAPEEAKGNDKKLKLADGRETSAQRLAGR